MMSEIPGKYSKKAGSPPGALVFTGEQKVEETRITVFDYDENSFEEIELSEVDECFPFKEKSTATWINVEGIHNTSLVEEIGNHFEIHPLVLEDILNPQQRPKIEDFDDYLYIVMKMLDYDQKEERVKSEQLSLVLGPNFVISFQEEYDDVFDTIRERIRNSKGRIRKSGSDYLVYALIDSVVDNYFKILEKMGERVESLEEELIEDPSQNTMETIQDLKQELIYLRKSVWPLREVINQVVKVETPLVEESTEVYLRDVYDHTIQVVDTIEAYRDTVSGMLDIYLSSVSNRMNEVMKVLTIIATIFIPLTFIAGIYGMNFPNMPELTWPYGYPAVLIIMIFISILMVFYFKRKDWI